MVQPLRDCEEGNRQEGSEESKRVSCARWTQKEPRMWREAGKEWGLGMWCDVTNAGPMERGTEETSWLKAEGLCW